MSENRPRIDRQLIYGVLFLGLIVMLVVGTVAKYRGVFERNVSVTVEADRAGLTLAKGAPVKLHGVEIGHVGGVVLDGSVVNIELDIDENIVDRVPADVTAQIVPPTAFGAKYVQLTAPRSGGSPSIQAGAVIPATRVTVEVDQAFENLSRVLDAAQPASVNAALTAVAGAVDQRGQLIGALISQTDQYLRMLNPALPTLAADVTSAREALNVYQRARPALMSTLARTGTISDAVVRQQASLRALEQSLTSFSGQADVLLRSSKRGILTTLSLLRPVTQTLARYSPEFPCVVLGLAAVNGPLEAAIGGTNPGLTNHTRIVPGRAPYRYPENLPLVGDNRGPVCYGLPDVTAAEATSPPPFMHTGANPYAGRQPTPSRSQLDELLAGLLPTRSTP